ncbi:YDG/SRA domain-containing protein [Gramella jeungdoensis]|uniref:YDG/SRA domain-containing protein n=1 Tax=Gramella jeungdoensis TaxID=708091 RepID=A0ABT0YZK3_9FLAO|nr:YDG/SRA domain-containing protein [Gramella jeungdoensis]MCM8568906.1 YDG/SRA domain-containing protein [Gramella jeungdoensis]
MSKIIFGNPYDIKEGTIYNNRYELIEAGLHRSTVRGIDGNASDGAAAIVMSGGYEDDYDLGEEILYTGEGGNDPSSGKQVAHQSWNSPGNAGLLKSMKAQYPIRVIRGWKHNSKFSPKEGYKFDGLFYVTHAEIVTGKSGYKICRFTLNKIGSEIQTPEKIQIGNLVLLKSPGKPEKWFAIGVEAETAQSISAESKMSQLLLGKKLHDTINFGPGFEILEIRRYLAT